MPTQNTDIFNPATDGLDFFADPQSLTVAAGVVVASVVNYGVNSNGYNNATLFNYGQIFAGYVDGVLFADDDGTIVNERNATITGLQTAIDIQGDHEMVDNLGSLVALEQGVHLGGLSNHTELDNRGSIYGHQTGVSEVSTNEGGTIRNFATIRSDQVGVEVSTVTGLTTLVVNAAAAVIKGPSDAILTRDAGAISLHNQGRLFGNIDCTVRGASDIVINRGNIHGKVSLGGGNDIFNGLAGKSGPIDGGDGNDTLSGGPGADKFVFDTTLNGLTNVDTIKNFTAAQGDKIVLSEGIFTGIGPHGSLDPGHFHLNHAGPSASPQIVYAPGSGSLYYDSNGHLAGGMTQFAALSTHPVIHAADFIVVA